MLLLLAALRHFVVCLLDHSSASENEYRNALLISTVLVIGGYVESILVSFFSFSSMKNCHF